MGYFCDNDNGLLGTQTRGRACERVLVLFVTCPFAIWGETAEFTFTAN